MKRSANNDPVGYRLDIPLRDAGGVWTEYSALRKPLKLEMAKGLADGLKRQNQPGRIVVITGREASAREFVELIEEWNS